MNRLRLRAAVLPLAALLLLSLGQTGCSNMSRTGRGAVIGAGTGAVVGGVIGRATGSTARGAIIGAAVGGTAGAIIGREMDRQAEELDQELENAQVERVSDPETGAEGITIVFDNAILFDFDSAALRPGVRADLADLAQSLEQYENHDAVIVGHTDATGSESYNQRLSERRAESVASFLLSNGVASHRLRTVGMGETQPVASNATASGRQENRRVEIAIYANEEYRERLEDQYGG
ncbi:MAG TPA: OmpA family protein [Rubricoccaceae bacterium]|nr:OmpA family protein [Rubricoccaceae bacterium]